MNQKYLITGAPRSGTSLMTILMSYFKGLNIDPTIETPPNLFTTLDAFKTPQRKDGLIWNDFIQPPMSIKDFTDRGVKVIVMLRDGRDVIVSKHNSNNKSDYWCSPERWINSVQGLIEIIGVVPSNMLHIVRYENLTIDLESEMNLLEQFVGLPLDESYSTFYEKHQQQNQITHAMNGVRPVSKNSGQWKLPEHSNRIKEVMNGEFGEQFKYKLEQLGYE